MAQEEHDKYELNFARKLSPEQIVGVCVQAAKFYCIANLQGLLVLALEPILKEQYTATLAQLKGRLHSPIHEHGSAMSAQFAITYQR